MHFLHLDVKKYFDQTNSSMFFFFKKNKSATESYRIQACSK